MNEKETVDEIIAEEDAETKFARITAPFLTEVWLQQKHTGNLYKLWLPGMVEEKAIRKHIDPHKKFRIISIVWIENPVYSPDAGDMPK